MNPSAMNKPNMPTTAMVLAAGLGTRMRPLTLTLPKPMVPVAGITLIDRALDLLAAAGIARAVVNTHYLRELLEAHLAARGGAPEIIISPEEVVLETGGGVKQALPLLGDAPFFAMNSDVIVLNGKTPALHRLWQAWNDDEMDALLLLQPVEKAVGYDGRGDFFCDAPAHDAPGMLRRRAADESAPLVFTGLQILHPRLFQHAPEGAFSLNLLYNQALPRIKGLVHDGGWLHVGDPHGITLAEAAIGTRCLV